MYLFNSLPVILTIPLAMYLHSKTCFENLHQTSNHNVSSFPFGNLAKLKASNEHEELDRLIQRRFGPEKRVNIIDMSLPEDLARDKGIFSNKTCTIDEQPSVYYYEYIMQGLLDNILITIVSSLMIQYSLVGIYVKIVTRRMKQVCLRLKDLMYQSVMVPVFDQSDSDGEFYVECSSVMLLEVDREESVAKVTQPEEKMVETIYNPPICDPSNLSPYPANDTEELLKCSGSTIKPEFRLKSASVNNNQAFRGEDNNQVICGLFYADDNIKFTKGTSSSTPRVSLPGSKTEEFIPAKFKKFLYEKNEEMERLGIRIDENGYIIEDPVPTKQMWSNFINVDHFVKNTKQAIWRKRTLY